ncbi:uncharacterized protein LOC115920185 [Strongylocentrotus purpuratus]|uniref:Uncharacterized protein n=1 Tax=Strongylocentrotus purpuratus TaxID=7668 RepID=A0A7M7N6G7_STRPU|nr:uncharacterized protein LOC115920185 [Strongylocentrotus purpuratus]
MKWRRQSWKGTILAVEDRREAEPEKENDSSDSDDDNMPLAVLAKRSVNQCSTKYVAQHCGHPSCFVEVWAACVRCHTLLCHGHWMGDDPCGSHSYFNETVPIPEQHNDEKIIYHCMQTIKDWDCAGTSPQPYNEDMEERRQDTDDECADSAAQSKTHTNQDWDCAGTSPQPDNEDMEERRQDTDDECADSAAQSKTHTNQDWDCAGTSPQPDNEDMEERRQDTDDECADSAAQSKTHTNQDWDCAGTSPQPDNEDMEERRQDTDDECADSAAEISNDDTNENTQAIDDDCAVSAAQSKTHTNQVSQFKASNFLSSQNLHDK